MERDIKKRAEYWNKKVFNNELDLNIPFKYEAKRDAYAWVRAEVVKQGKTFIKVNQIKGLFMSSEHEFTDDVFDAVLLHELCHLKMLQNYKNYTWIGGYHGREWQRMAIEVGRKAGLNVLDSENINVPTRKASSITPRYVLIGKYSSDRIYFSVISKPTMNGLLKHNSDGYFHDFSSVFLTLISHPHIADSPMSRGGIKWYSPKNPKVMVDLVKRMADKNDDSVKIIQKLK